MINHDYFSFQERICQSITLSLLVRNMEFVILGLNINEFSCPYPRLGEERGRNIRLGLLTLLFKHWWAHFIYKSIRK